MNVYVRELARALGQLGIQVDIFTRNHPGITSQIEDISPNVRVIHLPAGEPATPLSELFNSLPEFLRELTKFQQQNQLSYQVIHSHYWLSAWLGKAMSEEQDIPHVVTFHTLALIKMQSRVGEVEPEQRQHVEKEVMASARRIIAYSPHERDAMVRLYEANAESIELVPCGVDLAMFRPLDQQQARKRLGLNGAKVLLYVGRVEPLKGLDLLLHAAAHLETCLPVQMLVVGGDVEKDAEIERLRQLAHHLNVSEVVDFVGRVDQEELPFYYSAADVCVVPSFYESFGLAALESMACGTPVVAYRAGGLSTIIQHGRTGYLKSWRCPEAFANSLEMLISNNRLQHCMGLAARQRAEGMGWDQVASQIVRIYDA